MIKKAGSKLSAFSLKNREVLLPYYNLSGKQFPAGSNGCNV